MSKIHETSIIDGTAEIANSARIWAWTHIREGVLIGEETTVGERVYVGPGVTIGERVKIQNNCQIFEPSRIGDQSFLGPGVILTNDKNPRSTNSDGRPKTSTDWLAGGVEIGEGASIGAGAICVGPVKIGARSLVGAGAVVTADVLEHAVVLGVPAKHVGWVCTCGTVLGLLNETYHCSNCGLDYVLSTKERKVLRPLA